MIFSVFLNGPKTNNNFYDKKLAGFSLNFMQASHNVKLYLKKDKKSN